MEVGEGTFLVKFGLVEDQARILSLAAWLFDQHVLSLLPYVKEQNLCSYNFSIVPF